VEPGADRDAVAAALVAELRAWAAWLGFEGVAVGRRGDFSRVLGAALRA
jgi:uncharacterized protein YcaQ